jgi:rhodanese-related sulfurtransferase
MKTLPRLAMILIPLGLIVAAVPQNTTHPYKLTADQLLEEVNSRTRFLTPEMVADMMVKKDPSLLLIDVRSQEEYEAFSLPGAINIPVTDLLSEEHTELINQDVYMNVFYSNGTVIANEAWMITRQLGYENNYVLEGGLNYWFEVIVNPQKPSSTSPDEELARYNFRMAASKALGGGESTLQPAEKTATPQKPVIKPAAKKKKAAGGC